MRTCDEGSRYQARWSTASAAPEEVDLKTGDRKKSDDTGSEAETGFSGGLGIR